MRETAQTKKNLFRPELLISVSNIIKFDCIANANAMAIKTGMKKGQTNSVSHRRYYTYSVLQLHRLRIDCVPLYMYRLVYGHGNFIRPLFSKSISLQLGDGHLAGCHDFPCGIFHSRFLYEYINYHQTINQTK